MHPGAPSSPSRSYRGCSSGRIWIRLALTLAVLLVSARDGLTQLRYETGDVREGGSRDHLPLGNVSSMELERAALALPSVRFAIDRMYERGYVRSAEQDSGVASSQFSLLMLAFEKPELLAAPGDSDRVVLPTILVTTALDFDGLPVTEVSGGGLVLDAAGRISEGTGADAPFSVKARGGGGGKLSRHTIDGGWDEVLDYNSGISRFARCFGMETSRCVVHAVFFTGGAGAAAGLLKLASLIRLMTPQYAFAVLSACMILSVFQCLAR